MHALVIRHVAFEDLSAWGPPLAARGWRVTEIDMGVDRLSDHDPKKPDLLFICGGPIGVYEADEYPFLREEITFVARRIEAGLPTVGLCLGSQIIAAAAGARVYPSGVSEVGFMPISLTSEGGESCLAPFADDPITLHWHGDTFDLPRGARLLASTGAVTNQAFAIGDAVLGVQFHPEWGQKPLEPWLIGHTGELRRKGINIANFRAEAEKLRPALAVKAQRVLDLYLARAGIAV